MLYSSTKKNCISCLQCTSCKGLCAAAPPHKILNLLDLHVLFYRCVIDACLFTSSEHVYERMKLVKANAILLFFGWKWCECTYQQYIIFSKSWIFKLDIWTWTAISAWNIWIHSLHCIDWDHFFFFFLGCSTSKISINWLKCIFSSLTFKKL